MISVRNSASRTRIAVGAMSTPIGRISVFSDCETILAIEFEDQGRAAAILNRHYGAPDMVRRGIPQDVRGALEAYFVNGSCELFETLRLCPAGTEFQQTVWRYLRNISPGRTITYGELARAIGKPGAGRAVGAANGSNPIPVIIPCHRVIGQEGRLTGYGSGLDRKLWLLRHEGAAVTDPGTGAVFRHHLDLSPGSTGKHVP